MPAVGFNSNCLVDGFVSIKCYDIFWAELHNCLCWCNFPPLATIGLLSLQVHNVIRCMCICFLARWEYDLMEKIRNLNNFRLAVVQSEDSVYCQKIDIDNWTINQKSHKVDCNRVFNLFSTFNKIDWQGWQDIAKQIMSSMHRIWDNSFCQFLSVWCTERLNQPFTAFVRISLHFVKIIQQCGISVKKVCFQCFGKSERTTLYK